MHGIIQREHDAYRARICRSNRKGWMRRCDGKAHDSVLFAEQIKGLDGLFGQADEAAGGEVAQPKLS
jgi:hypothetical protein